MKPPRALAFGLTPWSFAVFAVLLTVVAVASAVTIIARTGETIVAKQERAALLDREAELAEVDSSDGRDALIAEIDRRDQLRDRGNRFALYDAARHRLAGGLPLPLRTGDDRVYRLPPSPQGGAALEVVTARLEDGALLVVARDRAAQAELRGAILRASGVAIAMVLAASLLAGVILNGQMLRRALGVARISERIARGDLSARVEITDRRDPFDRIGVVFNEMLQHIEELMTGMRTVTDSLAHDLRSPLTRLRSALAQAMVADATAEARAGALDRAVDETDQALTTISALLDIARAEAGVSREAMQAVDLNALVADVAELFAPVIEDAGQQLTVALDPHPVIVRGHAPLLRQSVGNLLHNAAHHAGAGARVCVATSGQGGVAQITVADTGPGVPDDQRGRVQQRFVRLDEARRTPGSGLGLAIVAACAKLHDGRLILADNHPGLRVVLELTAVAAAISPE